MNKSKYKYDVQGWFYKLDLNSEQKYRKFLDLKSIGTKVTKPQLIVIMMNPGSSTQKLGYENIFNEPVPTIHDKTQEHIMVLMDYLNVQYARIINLSDFCNKSSYSFYKFLNKDAKNQLNHTIFHESRKEELNVFKSTLIISAWGVNKVLNNIAKSAIQELENRQIEFIGLQHPVNKYGYYHPMRRVSKYHTQKWVEELKEHLTKVKSN